MSSYSPSGGIKEIARSDSNFDNRTHWKKNKLCRNFWEKIFFLLWGFSLFWLFVKTTSLNTWWKVQSSIAIDGLFDFAWSSIARWTAPLSKISLSFMPNLHSGIPLKTKHYFMPHFKEDMTQIYIIINNLPQIRLHHHFPSHMRGQNLTLRGHQ